MKRVNPIVFLICGWRYLYTAHPNLNETRVYDKLTGALIDRIPMPRSVFAFFLCWFFGPVDAREACVGPCVVAAAYTAVVDTARYTGMRWLICTCRRVLGGDRGLLWASPDYNFPSLQMIYM